jgi:hydrocephalus-inducing protein
MIALKASNKTTRGVTDSTFVVEPERLQIAPYSFAYATVAFTPSAMAPYSSYFEASLENMPNALKQKSELKFEIYGDGNLPRFSIIKPTLRNKKGQTLLLFKRCCLNHLDSQQLVLSNEGSLPTKVNFFMYDPDAAFKFRPTVSKSAALQHNGLVIKDNDETVSSVIIQPNTQISFTVTCSPKNVQTYQASLQLTVTDNQFEDTLIQLIGMLALKFFKQLLS